MAPVKTAYRGLTEPNWSNLNHTRTRTWVLSLDMLKPTIVNFSPASGRALPVAAGAHGQISLGRRAEQGSPMVDIHRQDEFRYMAAGTAGASAVSTQLK